MKKLRMYKVREKASQFLSCQSLKDLSQLGIDINSLQLLALNPPYYTFELRKSKGGFRTIEAPENDLKLLQRQFNHYLQCVYYTIQSKSAHGYIIAVKDGEQNKNILENARAHLGANYMLNADFKDFFHQISTKNISLILQKPPFRFKKTAARILSKLFTFKGRLPMGAPTSPVLSNIAALKLDDSLNQYAENNEVVFTRFVDDLTFSSKQVPLNSKHLEEVSAICQSYNMRLNPSKTKLFYPADKKKVTGLVLNDSVDIEPQFYEELKQDLGRLRSMAEVNVIMDKHNRNDLVRDFKQEVEGKINFIGMIEGYDSKIFYDYRKKLKASMNPKEEVLSIRWANFNYL